MTQGKSPGRREQKKNAVRSRVTHELIGVISEGLEINHDLIAKRAKVPRRTLYRYFPDRESLLEAAWEQVATLGFQHVVMPETESDLVDLLDEIFTGLDRIAPIATIIQSTPQGRAIRRASNRRRVQSYTAAAAEAVMNLAPEDQKLATAMLQVLQVTPWLEMRDHWGLTGEQIARATKWAMRTLLRDLHTRGSLPLDVPASSLAKAAPRERRAKTRGKSN